MSYKPELIKHATAKQGLLRVGVIFLYLLINAIVNEAHVMRNDEESTESMSRNETANGSIPCSSEEVEKSKCLNDGQCVKPTIYSALFMCRCTDEFDGAHCENKVMAFWRKLMTDQFYQFLLASFLILIVFFTFVFICLALKRYRRGYTTWKEESG